MLITNLHRENQVELITILCNTWNLARPALKLHKSPKQSQIASFAGHQRGGRRGWKNV